MSLSYFYTEASLEEGNSIILDEDTSKHITQVLRMKNGDELILTDGKGVRAKAAIIDDHRKRCSVTIVLAQSTPVAEVKISIAISLIKNASRFEWFLEKATEIGVTEIIPLLCERTEKEKFRTDRLKSILVSAMLQSQQSRMPVLHVPTDFSKVLELPFPQKFVTHCLEEKKETLHQALVKHSNSSLVLIGPEGDFSYKEIQDAINHQFLPVSLGNTRLRTETAGLVAATLLKNFSAG